jgi:hypothetical protein
MTCGARGKQHRHERRGGPVSGAERRAKGGGVVQGGLIWEEKPGMGAADEWARPTQCQPMGSKSVQIELN